VTCILTSCPDSQIDRIDQIDQTDETDPVLHPEQKRIYQSMSPVEKLQTVMNLCDFARELKAAGLRSQYPDWSEEHIEDRVKEIFLYART